MALAKLKMATFVLTVIALVVMIVLMPVTHAHQLFTAGMATEDIATIEQVEQDSCVCKVQLPIEVICTDYQTKNTLQKLQEVNDQITNLTLDVTDLYEISNSHRDLIDDFQTNLADVSLTYFLIEGGQLYVTRDEIEEIREKIQSMTSSLETLQEWYGPLTDALRAEGYQNLMNDILNISKVVEAMVSQDTSGHLVGLGLQYRIAELVDQLKMCGTETTTKPSAETVHQTPSTIPSDSPPAADEGPIVDGEVPERWPVKDKQDSCQRLLSVSEPYTLRGNLMQYGSWMRDPIVNPQFVYYTNFSSGTKAFEGSESARSFQTSQTHRLVGSLQTSIVEAIAYNGSLFAYSETTVQETTTASPRQRWHGSEWRGYGYQNVGDDTSRSREVKKLSKVDLSTDSVDSLNLRMTIERELSSSDTPVDLHAYTAPSQVPKMDFSVDETGLWLLYGDDAGMLAISKLNQDTLEFDHTWNQGSYPKNLVGNCFVICKKVYCLSSYNKYDARVSYYKNTESGFEGFINIPFSIKYGGLSSIEYNPRDQMLYGWDNGHAVVYSLTFE